MLYKILFVTLLCVLYVHSASIERKKEGSIDLKRKINPKINKSNKFLKQGFEGVYDEVVEEEEEEVEEVQVQYCENTYVECDHVKNGEFLLNPYDCSTYCRCEWGKPVLSKCPENLHFNITAQACDWPLRAGCTTKIAELQAKIIKQKSDEKKAVENIEMLSKVVEKLEEQIPEQEAEEPIKVEEKPDVEPVKEEERPAEEPIQEETLEAEESINADRVEDENKIALKRARFEPFVKSSTKARKAAKSVELSCS